MNDEILNSFIDYVQIEIWLGHDSAKQMTKTLHDNANWRKVGN